MCYWCVEIARFASKLILKQKESFGQIYWLNKVKQFDFWVRLKSMAYFRSAFSQNRWHDEGLTYGWKLDWNNAYKAVTTHPRSGLSR